CVAHKDALDKVNPCQIRPRGQQARRQGIGRIVLGAQENDVSGRGLSAVNGPSDARAHDCSDTCRHLGLSKSRVARDQIYLAARDTLRPLPTDRLHIDLGKWLNNERTCLRLPAIRLFDITFRLWRRLIVAIGAPSPRITWRPAIDGTNSRKDFSL